MAAKGLTVVTGVVAPLLQLYELPPDAVSVAVPPEQSVGVFEEICMFGKLVTVTLAVFVSWHVTPGPVLVPVTA